MNWRRAFLERAHTVVKGGINQYLENNPKAMPTDIAAWVQGIADLKTGAAWFEIPGTPPVRLSFSFLALFLPHT